MKTKESLKKEILEISLLIANNRDISFIKDMAMIKLSQLVSEYKKHIEENGKDAKKDKRDEGGNS